LEQIGVLVICYGSRGVAMADTLLKSQNYTVKLYIVDKQRNPFNAKIAEKHVVIPSLDTS